MAGTKHIGQWTRLMAGMAVLAILIAGVVMVDARPAEGQFSVTITVDTLTDVADDRDGLCSLREAIVSANTNSVSGPVAGECVAGGLTFADLIDFSVIGTITLGGTELPPIVSSFRIDGDGNITVSGDLQSRVFTVNGGFVTFSSLSIEKGAVIGNGGAINVTAGNLTIDDSIVTQSTASGGGGGIAVQQPGHLNLVDSGVVNSTGGRSGGIAVFGGASADISGATIGLNEATGVFGGGAIYNNGSVTITDSLFINNEVSADDGSAAIHGATFGSTVITNTSINGNLNSGSASIGRANIIGGGISLTLSGVTVAGNASPDGAVYGAETFTIVNSTISGNQSPAGVQVDNLVDVFTMTYSTIADNDSIGLFLQSTTAVTIGSSVIGLNSGLQVYAGQFFNGPFTSEGFNVIGGVSDDSAGQIVDFESIHDRTSVATSLLALGPLANNGGSTLTHQPGDGSLAIDRVTRPVSNEPVDDQRGTARPQGPARDAGAVEVVNGVASCEGVLPTINMNTNGGNGTGTPGTDWILGTPGADVINSGGGDDVICGGDGDDVIRSGAGNDWIFGEGGNDVLRGGGGSDNILGGVENDQIFGQGGSDDLFGGPGDDEMHGLGAADTLEGGTGNDTMSGQNGGDAMLGEAGDDVLRGHTGPDTLIGGLGDDDLFGGNGADTLLGGDGIDKCAGNSGPDSAQASSCESTPGVENLF